MKQRKKRGRKESDSSHASQQSQPALTRQNEEELQDHMVSSSNIEDVPASAKKVLDSGLLSPSSPPTSKPSDGEASERNSVDSKDEAASQAASSKQSRAAGAPGKSAVKPTGRMAPKSKTWFPRDDRGAARAGDGLTSPPQPHLKAATEADQPTPPTPPVVVAKEADPAVFFGKEADQINTLLSSDFGLNPGNIDAALAETFNQGHKMVSQLSIKLADKTKAKLQQEKEGAPATSACAIEEEVVKDNVKLCSKIKLFRPSTGSSNSSPGKFFFWGGGVEWLKDE